MNRNLIVTIVVVILIVAAGSYYFMNRSDSAPSVPVEVTSSAQPTSTTEKISLKDFLVMQGTQKCDFTDSENGNSGTVYLNSGKMRGDFSTTIAGKASMTHMINDGKDAYVWMDDQETGFRTSFAAIEQMSGQTGVSSTVDINKKVDYKCESWGADSSKFTVPSDKKFNDLGKMMEDAMKRMPSASANTSTGLSEEDSAAACSACNNLTGDAQAQCKRALKCS